VHGLIAVATRSQPSRNFSVSGADLAKNGCRSEARPLPSEEVIFGFSTAMAGVRKTIEKLKQTDVPVLIEGENGTGKGLLAEYIHSKSVYSGGKFVKVNCAAIPGMLLESELFGYEKGAFTDAHHSRAGLVEVAERGTLFLDEITELDLNLQAKLLHLLQDGHYSRIGDKQDRKAETRIICATNKRLHSEIETGRFRQDLYYRINVISICLPRLRDRREDIPLLAEFFRDQFNSRFERNQPPLPLEIVDALSKKEWRGNIRELENVVARYTILGSVDILIPEKRLGASSENQLGGDGQNVKPLRAITKQAIREMESNLILKTLQENRWNRRKTAMALSISYRALIYKIREAGLASKGGRLNQPPDGATGNRRGT
jgi:two-component system, NtrC family, response regulator AtoC